MPHKTYKRKFHKKSHKGLPTKSRHSRRNTYKLRKSGPTKSIFTEPTKSIFSKLFKGGDASEHAIQVYGGTDAQHTGANGAIYQNPPISQEGGKKKK